MTRRISCGVVITDGQLLLLGHATFSPRWDIPKGLAEPGETLPDAALRELREETGLLAASSDLVALGGACLSARQGSGAVPVAR